MTSEKRQSDIEFTPEFKRNIRQLSKKYRNIKNDVQPFIEQLKNGHLEGDQISGVGYTVFKVRIKNSDVRKGKSAGYRVIYFLQTIDKIILITVYSKSEQGDISTKKIRELINQFDAL